MPWEKRDLMSLKTEFLERALDKKTNITALCLEFGISRKTAYKWIRRYKKEGLQGLESQSKRPLSSPFRTSEEMVSLILRTRKIFHWGGRKLREYLRREGMRELPSEATINRILLCHEEIEEEESEKRKHWIRFERETPNELWQMDFKGHFKLYDNGRCHPLTILDDHSRFSICIKACACEDEKSVREGLEIAFRNYGLPEEMTMDNGAPWRGSQRHLSRLTVWLMRLGIKVHHSTPGHPQTQGKLERFHRSLKEEVLKYHQFSSLKNAQVRFDEWKELYNNQRPHEGIGLLCPKDRYKPSPRIYPEKLPEIEYSLGEELKKVGLRGTIYFKGKHYFAGQHLAGEYVAIKEIENGIYDIYFCKTKIQRLNLKEQKELP
jgi:transposase InsO family protein